MQKFVNDQNNMVDESIIGFVKCYPDIVAHTDCPRTLKYLNAPVAGKVGVVSGGGWGHEPAFMGYTSAKTCWTPSPSANTFTPPSVESFCAAFRAADAGKGVVCLYGNYPKDIINAEKAVEIVAAEGIRVVSIISNDDIATNDPSTRRGTTGEVFLWKIGGAAAALGYDQEAVASVSMRALENTRSIGVGIASCIIPEVGRPELPD